MPPATSDPQSSTQLLGNLGRLDHGRLGFFYLFACARPGSRVRDWSAFVAPPERRRVKHCQPELGPLEDEASRNVVFDMECGSLMLDFRDTIARYGLNDGRQN